MLVELRDQAQLKMILDDLEAQFAALPLFRAGRRGIVEGYAGHAAKRCEELVRRRWHLPSSPHFLEAKTVIERLGSTFRAILRAAATTAPGNGNPTAAAVAAAAEVAAPFVIVTKALRHMLDSGAWGTARYDADARELVLAPQDETQERESFNSKRLREAEERKLREGVRRGFSVDADPDDLHHNDVERLNPAYTQRTFGAIMRALRGKAHEIVDLAGLCAIDETDRVSLERDLVVRSGVAPEDVSVVIGDLLFTFDPKQDGEQFLIEVEPGRVAVIPLLVVERSLFASEYARISKALYPAAYGAHHRALTRTLEDQVGAALRMHAPHAEVRPMKLPGALAGMEGGQIDRVAADPNEDALLLVQVKYTFAHDNDLIAEGVRQLQRDESVVRKRWAEVSKALRGWQGRGFPAYLGKLLVTKWFLGTNPIPNDIRVLALEDDLRAMPSVGSLRALIERIAALPEPRLVPKYEQRVPLLGYTFFYYTTQG